MLVYGCLYEVIDDACQIVPLWIKHTESESESEGNSHCICISKYLINNLDRLSNTLVTCGAKNAHKGTRDHAIKVPEKTIGVSQSTPTLVVYGETGRFPLQLRQEDSIIRLWARIQPFPHTNFLCKIYTDLLLLHDQGNVTWAGHVNAFWLSMISLMRTWNIQHPWSHSFLNLCSFVAISD